MRLNAFVLALLLLFGATSAYANTVEYPVKGTVTMIDLGAKTCIPCKMMAPILEKLENEYRGRADIVFIDVREDVSQVSKYRISTIPTQIFYNKAGEEIGRHEGFLDEKSIREVVDKLLAE